MKVIKFKMIDNDKFKKGIEISFEANNRKKDNTEFVNDGILKWNIIFGKNASGKSSVYRALVSYFNIFSKINIGGGEYERDSLIPNTNRWLNHDNFNALFQYSNKGIDKGISKFGELLKKQYEDNPKYTLTYKYNDKIYVHEVLAKLNDFNQPVFKHKIFLENSFRNIIKSDSFLPSLRLTSLDDNSKASHHFSNKYNDFISTLKSFIDTTSKAVILPNTSSAARDEEIVYHINDIMSSGDEKSLLVLEEVARWTDNNFVKFKNFAWSAILPMAVINTPIGEKSISIENLSTGTRWAIYTALKMQIVIDSSIGGLFIKDEFEIFLHRDIANYLLKSPLESSKFQGFATSHSPHIFDYEIRYDSISYIKNINNSITIEEFRDKNSLPRPDRKISSLYYDNPYTNPED